MRVVVTVTHTARHKFSHIPEKNSNYINKNKNVSSSAVFQVRQTNLVRLFAISFVLLRLVSFLYLSIYLSFLQNVSLSP